LRKTHEVLSNNYHKIYFNLSKKCCSFEVGYLAADKQSLQANDISYNCNVWYDNVVSNHCL